MADPIAMERKAFVERAFLGLGAVEIQWLDRMQMSGRPTGCPDETWRALERSGLVERDFAGPKGIKDELRVAIANALSVFAALEPTRLRLSLELAPNIARRRRTPGSRRKRSSSGSATPTRRSESQTAKSWLGSRSRFTPIRAC